MTAVKVTLTCPGCGAKLTLMSEDSETNSGALVCEHGHVFDVSDPDDDRELRARFGAEYRQQLHAA